MACYGQAKEAINDMAFEELLTGELRLEYSQSFTSFMTLSFLVELYHYIKFES